VVPNAATQRHKRLSRKAGKSCLSANYGETATKMRPEIVKNENNFPQAIFYSTRYDLAGTSRTRSCSVNPNTSPCEVMTVVPRVTTLYSRRDIWETVDPLNKSCSALHSIAGQS
jgi:hypothetical protein